MIFMKQNNNEYFSLVSVDASPCNLRSWDLLRQNVVRNKSWGLISWWAIVRGNNIFRRRAFDCLFLRRSSHCVCVVQFYIRWSTLKYTYFLINWCFRYFYTHSYLLQDITNRVTDSSTDTCQFYITFKWE